MNQHDRDDPQAMARRALDWFNSAEGQRSIQESERRVKETADLLEKGREIDPAKLHEPFTV
jgi:hypothetical protein